MPSQESWIRGSFKPVSWTLLPTRKGCSGLCHSLGEKLQAGSSGSQKHKIKLTKLKQFKIQTIIINEKTTYIAC